MAALSGIGGKVMYGSVTVAEQVEWSMSGFSRAVTDKPTAFSDTIKVYVAADAGDPGTIAFRGNYDPADTTGQIALSTLCQAQIAGTGVTNLYLYANTSTFWRVASGGNIIITRVNAITMPRSGFGTISFEGQASTKAMEQVGTGT